MPLYVPNAMLCFCRRLLLVRMSGNLPRLLIVPRRTFCRRGEGARGQQEAAAVALHEVAPRVLLPPFPRCVF